VAAILNELDTFRSMEVFEVHEQHPKDKPLPGMYLFTRKMGDDGNVIHKAQWIARGDFQKPGIDFHDTFAQAGNLTSYKLVIVLAATPTASVSALDIKGAFLYMPMAGKEVVMHLPQMFDTDISNPVGILRKAVYGLWQALLAFRNHLHSKMHSLGYHVLVSNPSMFYKHIIEGESKCIMASFYVNDGFAVTWTGKPQDRMAEETMFIDDVKKEFMVKEKDVRKGAMILGIKMEWDAAESTMRLSVANKIEQLAKDFRLEGVNGASTSMLPDALKTFEDDASGLDTTFPYASAVGALLWIGCSIRVDIAYTVNVLSRYMTKPQASHVTAVK
jgi:hypothetical protein